VNTVVHAAAEAAEFGGLLGVTTIQFLVFFTLTAVWVWLPGRKADHAAAARLPFDTGDDQ